MQSKNKNDGVQLSTRYEQYCFAKRHLRVTRRPEVFPFGESSKNTTKSDRKDSSVCTPPITTQGGKNCRGMFIEQLNNPTHSNDRVYGTDGVSPTLNTMQGGNRQPFISKTVRVSGRGSPHDSKQNWDSYEFKGKIRRLTPTECMRLQGFPDDWCDGISDSQKYKCAGNAVTVNVIRDMIQDMKKRV